MTIFVTGGCKNGKSTFALKSALALDACGGPKYYVATLKPEDEEQLECIKIHREARKHLNFLTIECPLSLSSALEGVDKSGVFLLDSVTALLFNEMYSSDGKTDKTAASRIISDIGFFAENVSNLVIVSDYIYSDGMDYDPETREFAKSLARIDCFLAEKCDCVVEICAGIPSFHKGSLALAQ